MTERIQVATNLHGPIRTEQYMGREHLVVSAVLVKAKVLNNNLGRTLLPASDITPEWAEVVNGTPAVADHPHTSARSPAVMNELGVGFLYRARAENGELKADVFLDPTRADEVTDLKVILAKLAASEKVEVSTGFPVSIEETPGVFNGAKYDRVIHPTGFDHLAVFAEQTGACSVEDGCGLAQNTGDGCGCGELPEPPDAEAAVSNTKWRGFLEAAAKLMGFKPSEIDDAGADPAGEPAAKPNPGGGETMNREQMVALLAEQGTDTEALAKLSDCQLRALVNAAGGGSDDTDDSAAWRVAHEYRQKYEDLQAQTANAVQDIENETARLLDDILFKQDREYTDQEVRNMDIAQLRKLHKTMFPPVKNFAGRGAPVGNASGSFSFVEPVMKQEAK